MINPIRTITSGLKSYTDTKIEKSKANWNQNDPAADNYIKNRTHWEEKKEVIIIPSLNVTFEYIDGENTIWSYICNGNAITVNQEYIVNWNGVEYKCKGVNLDGIFIGNPAIWYYSQYADKDNGIPFCIYNYGTELWCGIFNPSSGINETHNVKVISFITNIHTIDEKYIPASIIENINNAQITSDEALNIANGAQALANTNTTNLTTEISNREIADELKMNKENPEGTGSFSMNRKENTNIGSYSHAEGYKTTASEYASHAEGYYTTASGIYSHVEGYNTFTSGLASHVEGNHTSSCTNYSHVTGQYNIIDLPYKEDRTFYTGSSGITYPSNETFYYSENYEFDKKTGLFTLISPSRTSWKNAVQKSINASLDEFSYNIYIAPNKTNEKLYVASSDSELQINSLANPENATLLRGVELFSFIMTLNDSGPGIYAHIVGNGTSNTARSNAHTLDWGGNGWFAGDVYINGASQDDENAKKLATEDYVTTQLAEVEAELYNLIVDAQDIFRITITKNEDETFSSDKTFLEICNAIDSNKQLILIYDSYNYALEAYWPDEEIDFYNIQSDGNILQIRINWEDQVSLYSSKIQLYYNTLTTTNKSVDSAINEINSKKANQTDLDALEELVGTTSVQSQISSAIADLVDTAPETLDTLSELATAIQENDTVIDTLNAAIANKADKTEIVQSDWNQSDETANDFIKNRTHYSKITSYRGEMFGEEKTIVTSEDGSTYPIEYDIWDISNASGDYVEVVFDGISYICLITKEGIAKCEIGDPNLIEYPFYYYHYLFDSEITFAKAGEHTVAMYDYITEEVVTPLNEKFIPDSIARRNDILKVTINGTGIQNDPYVADKTFVEIKTALNNGVNVICYHDRTPTDGLPSDMYQYSWSLSNHAGYDGESLQFSCGVHGASRLSLSLLTIYDNDTCDMNRYDLDDKDFINSIIADSIWTERLSDSDYGGYEGSSTSGYNDLYSPYWKSSPIGRPSALVYNGIVYWAVSKDENNAVSFVNIEHNENGYIKREFIGTPEYSDNDEVISVTHVKQADVIVEFASKSFENTLEETNTNVAALQNQITATSLILADIDTGVKYKIQIQSGQLVSSPVEEE